MTQPISEQDYSADNGSIVLSEPLTTDHPEWLALRAEVNFIYTFLMGFGSALSKMSDNPMMRTMGRQFGMDLDAMKGMIPSNGE